MPGVRQIRIQGFKSIRDQELTLSPLNVFIGGNGAGKSNLVEAFRFILRVFRGDLQAYTQANGGASSILHFGPDRTDRISFDLRFGPEDLSGCGYSFSLTPTAQDGLVFEDESAYLEDDFGRPGWSGHQEARIAGEEGRAALAVRNQLEGIRIHHFHDTGSRTALLAPADLAQDRVLKEDGSNLAAFLHRLKIDEPEHLRIIEDLIGQVAPFFQEFRLEPSGPDSGSVRLEWLDKDGQTPFNASHLSDGTLRFIFLAALLLQPDPPSLILIDEPELGLHPSAVQVLAGLIQSAAEAGQLIVATQSVTLLNQLTPDHVWVVERGQGGESLFMPLQEKDISGWLEDYGLGDLWEKNLLGGRP